MKDGLCIAVDLGGTKVAVGGVFDVGAGSGTVLFKRLIHCTEFDLPLSSEQTGQRADFLNAIVTCVAELISEAKAEGWEVNSVIGFASPGLHHEGKIWPGSTEQLGSVFDNFAMQDELNKLLSERLSGYRFCVKNDALAQAAVGVQLVLKSLPKEERFLGKKFCYLGPGSSLGGAFGICQSNSGEREPSMRVDFLANDGHVFDIFLEGELAHHKVSGLFFLRRSREIFGEAIDAKSVASRLQEEAMQALVRQAGENLGKLVALIHKGGWTKPEAHRQWSLSEVKEVAGTQFFILGASIATKGEMGNLFRKSARAYLDQEGFHNIRLFPIQGDSAEAALMGAAELGRMESLG